MTADSVAADSVAAGDLLDSPPIDRLRAQDHDAFGALVERYYARIGRYVARVVGHQEVAAELTQETFLRAYHALPRLADDSDVGAWLYRIATNLARQHHRHGQLICWARLEPHHARDGGPEDDVARRDQVRRALSRLTLDQRVCLLLYAWTGYTCAEIGEITGRSADAVRMLLVRARRRFGAAFGSYEALAMDDAETTDRGLDTGGTDGADAGTGTTDGLDRTRGRDGSGRGRGRGCGAIDRLLPLYPRGDLSLDEFAAVTRHLAGCERCREALLEVQATYRLVQRHLHTAAIGGAGERPARVMARVAGAAAEAAEAAVMAPASEAVLVAVRAARLR